MLERRRSLPARTVQPTRLLVVAVILMALGPALCTAPEVEARASRELPSPFALALRASTFPPGALVRGQRAVERTLEAASRLHTVALADLGHVEGYLQTAWWRSSPRGRGSGRQIMLAYMASIFGSTAQAATAYGDSQSSLWELGQPLQGTVGNSHLFTVSERDGHGNVYLLLHRGTIEMELRLRYVKSLDRVSLQAALWYLWRAGIEARRRATLLAPSLPSGAAAPDVLPQISTAPWGTGPVVKSPALMVLAGSALGEGSTVDQGGFRSFSGPPLESRAVGHAEVVSAGELDRYAVTATGPGGRQWYDSAMLYETAAQAEDAFRALAAANRAHTRLRRSALDPAVWGAGRLKTIDAVAAWKDGSEQIFLLRLQNVLMVLGETGASATEVVHAVDGLVATVPTWLHAQGTDIVTASGDPIRLASVNWYGAEENDFVVGGLDYQPYQAILQRIKRLGVNSLRLPFSNQLVEENPVVSARVAANPELSGMRALDILDRIISYAGALGISVILDDHRSDAGWSTQPDGLWYTTKYPDTAFVQDWATMARRYLLNNAVVGADLRNEPHGKASWADGNLPNDWHAAAERGGNAALAANPHLLIMVEGIQYYKQAVSYWWGGSLQGVADAPVVLHFADGSSARSQLVYSIHDYGPDLCGKGCPWFNKSASYQSLAQIWEQYWGYVVDDAKQPYAAPIWVGEFGTCDYQLACVADATPGSQGQWFSSLVRFIGEKRVSWGYWAVNGTESTGGSRVYGTLDWYGFFDHTWTAPYAWLEEGLRPVMSDWQTATG